MNVLALVRPDDRGPRVRRAAPGAVTFAAVGVFLAWLSPSPSSGLAAQEPASRLDRVFHGVGYRGVDETRPLGPRVVLHTPGDHGRDAGRAFMGTVWAGLWSRDEDGSAGAGVWRPLPAGSPVSPAVTSLAVSPTNPEVLWVGTGFAGTVEPGPGVVPGSGVYRSGDGGETWELDGLDTVAWIADLAVTGGESPVVYAAAIDPAPGPDASGGLYRREPDGTWSRVLVADSRAGSGSVVVTGGRTPAVYAALHGGEGGSEVRRSRDGGATWVALGGGLPAGAVGRIGLAASEGNPLRLWALVEADGERGGLYHSADGGDRWSRVRPLEGLVPSGAGPPLWPELVADGGDPGRLTLRRWGEAPLVSRDGGRSWEPGPGPGAGPGSSGELPGRGPDGVPSTSASAGNRAAPEAISSHDPEVRYRYGAELERSDDGGRSWHTVERADSARATGAGGAVPTVLAESPLEPGILWVGWSDGVVELSRDGGLTWTPVARSHPGSDAAGRVGYIDPSPHDPGRAWIAVDRSETGDLSPYVYRVEDYGGGWTRVSGSGSGFRLRDPVAVVREDPESPGLVLAGTALGVYVSFDNGGSWDELQLDLPRSPIDRLEFVGRDLVVETVGRGRYVMDELQPVREVIRGLATGEPYLFQPAPVESGGRGSERGAILDYLLPSFVGSVVLEVVDVSGAVVASFRSPPRGRGRAMADGPPSPSDLGLPGARAGLHRVRWDLSPGDRGPDAPRTGPSGGGSSAGGGTAVLPAGRYLLRMRVDGLVRERVLEVLPER